MRALTLWQPWASAIACGAKRVETRDWPTDYRGPLAIHAAKKWDLALDGTARHLQLLYAPELGTPRYPSGKGERLVRWLPLGAVVAVAELADCRLMDAAWIAEQTPLEHELGGWEEGRYGLVLRNVRPLKKPYALKGRQGKPWRLGSGHTEAILRRAGAA